ncbi:hypothetical protein BGZ80_000440 [Entomortierella chlamydospora]|uniref:Uncharacterized protein n=1 Tax=Entomortierella chlamydospora TaxID=101097 RepID=A0A9P6MTC5_9FUNG|nr:hypothetical protein BGZ80_000440 [Entomortierella chlamydospora]
MSIPIPGAIDPAQLPQGQDTSTSDLARSHTLPLHTLSPAVHPALPTTSTDLISSNSNNGGTHQPLHINPAYQPSPAEQTLPSQQSVPLSTPTLPTVRVNVDGNPLTPANNESSNINHTISDRSKSLPAPLTNRDRANFTSFNPRSGLSKPMRGVSALGALITASSTAVYTGMTNTVQTKPTTENSKNKRRERSEIRPFYRTVSGFIHPRRSMSYSSIPSPRTSPFLTPIETSSLESNSMESYASEEGNPLDCTAPDDTGQSRELRKGQGFGKSRRKALKMKFRRLQRRRGPRESDDCQDEVTSESDPEADVIANRGDGSRGIGLARKLADGLPTSKAEVLNTDPSLLPPSPQPQTRAISGQSRESPIATVPAYAMVYESGSVRTMPLSVVTKGSSIPAAPVVISEQTSRAFSMPSTPWGEPSRGSSTTRFKEMIKRNVGLSSASPSTPTMPSSTATSPSVVKSNYQPWSAIGDFLISGDDQPSSKFSVSRLTGRRKKSKKIRRRRKGFVGAGLGAGVLGVMARRIIGREDASIDEDDEDATFASMRENPHQHHFRAFIPHLLQPVNEGHPHGGLDPVLEEAPGGQAFDLKTMETQRSPISRALAEARQFDRDPNVLLAELEPLPADFANAFSALTAPPVSAETVPTPNAATTKGWSSMPPSSPALATATGGWGGEGVNGGNTLQTPVTNGMSHSATMPSTISALSVPLLTTQGTPPLSTSPSSSISQPKSVKPDPPELRPLAPRSFLFKSYQHSRFHGRYAYYVFRIRENYIEYGKLPVSLDHACAEYFHEADRTYRELENKAKLWHEERRAALMKREKEFEEVRQTGIRLYGEEDEEAGVFTEVSGNESDASSCYKYDEDITDSRSVFEKLLRVTAETNGPNNLDTDPTKSIPNLDGGFFRRDRSPSSFSNSDAASISSAATTPATSHFGTSERSDDPKCRGRDPSPSLVVESEHGSLGTEVDSHNPLNIPNMTEGVWEQTACPRELAGLEEMQRAIDNAYWRKVERNHYEDSRQQLHGLHLYLSNLTENVEYELYEKTCDIEILKAKRNATLFEIINGDKTNPMWLESPSLKQKDEFLNWIAICLVGRENYMIDIANIQITLLQGKLQTKRAETQQTMRELEVTLRKLNHLDDNAKKLAVTLGRTLDTSEVKNALQPSSVTGLTLAQTVECKIKDVNERIMVCSRIMNAARLNLNRLQYEIELEQRSIRLFRQYKIGIAVVTILVIGTLWLLYNRRDIITMNLFKPAMSPVPLSPLEEASQNLQCKPVMENGLTRLSQSSFEVCRYSDQHDS